MSHRLRVGVVGLGRRWRRCRAALPDLRNVLEVTAVCDPRPGRAERAARSLGCDISDGVTELLDRHDVQALLLLDPPWFGLWPLEAAADAGKPVFCAGSLVPEDERADALHERLSAARLPLLMDLPPLTAPALLQLMRLRTADLGPIRLVRAERVVAPPPEGAVDAARLLASRSALGLLHTAATLLGEAPRGILAVAAAGRPPVVLLLDGSDGRAAQVSLWCGRTSGSTCRVEVIAANGTLTVDDPRQLRWRDRTGEHLQRLSTPSPTRARLERFVRLVRAGQPMRPDFADAHRALRLLRAARQSLAEGRRVPLAAP